MYTDWFKLNRLPFRLRPDPDFLYLFDEVGQVFARLSDAATAGQGVVSLIGEPGVGKTTLLRYLAEQRKGSASVARIQQPDLTAPELAEALVGQFEIPAVERAARTAAVCLTRFIAAQAGRGRTVLILVDEAHRCSDTLLRGLLALEAKRPGPMLVLAGEEALLSRLMQLEAQGVAVHSVGVLRLPRLALAQIEGYLLHRLRAAGSDGRALFERDSLVEIMRYTGGTPQLINLLCDSAMALAKAHNSQRVGASEIRDAAQDLKWVEFAAGAPIAVADSNATPAALPTPAIPRRVIQELDVRLGGKSIGRVTLKPGRLVVGRAEDAGLRLDDKFISRQHCRIITTEVHSFVEDLGSTNSILLNGVFRRFQRLTTQDAITVGDHTLIYLETPVAGI
ncbi:MAG: AAA family ATPase [Steroidobacteraceae bacterium]